MESLLRKAKPEVAAALRAKCKHSENDQLTRILDDLLSASRDIDDSEVIDWLSWLIAGGFTPEEFSSTVRLYDRATTCGIVWTENFIAYRCRTCRISKCMSLCTDCFLQGNHEGHDFMVYRSTTNGACDCGETNVIKESGCCSMHGPQGNPETAPAPRTSRSSSSGSDNGVGTDQSAPPELLYIANGMMPYLFLRLILSMREESRVKAAQTTIVPQNRPRALCKHAHGSVDYHQDPGTGNLSKGHKFIKMLQGFSDIGVAMKQVMIHALTQPHIYYSLLDNHQQQDIQQNYEKEIGKPEFKTFLEELVYWIVKFEFPEDLIFLVLSLRSDASYKEAFAKAFIKHYALISETILKSSDPEKLWTHAVAVSVQIFSIEKLAVKMVEQERLLHLLVSTLDKMIETAMLPHHEESRPGSKEITKKLYVDCNHDVIKNNFYCPIMSDLRQLLSYQQVAFRFFEDEQLVDHWLEILARFEGMNAIKFIPKGHPHTEHETDTHNGSLLAEIDISATTMWTLVSHLKDNGTSHFTKRIVQFCWTKLKKWSKESNFQPDQVSFHLPLHRNLSLFIHQGLRCQSLQLPELLPLSEQGQLKTIVYQLIKLQSAFYQILGRMWLRNGRDVINQANSYVSSDCCNSMIDADIFLLQTISTAIPRSEFLRYVLDEFRIPEILGLSASSPEEGMDQTTTLEQDDQTTLLESCLLFLATIASSRVNLGLSDEGLMALEMSTLLCQGDKLHSELMERIPERCGSDSQLKNFEPVLSQVADFHAPKNMQQGMYTPKPIVWQELYDPIHTLLRTVKRSSFQASLDRFQENVKRRKLSNVSTNLWPPFRIPPDATEPFCDPRNLLRSNLVMEVLFIVLYKSVHFRNVPTLTLSLTVYLLEMAISFESEKHSFESQEQVGTFLHGKDFLEILTTDVEVSRLKLDSETNAPRSESILSLLLKLYANLKCSAYNYVPPPLQAERDYYESKESRIGDGAHFVGIALDRIINLDDRFQEFVLKEIALSSPNNNNIENIEKEKEEKRRKAKERKLQIMTEFAMKRQQFMKEVEIQESEDASETKESSRTELECVICLEKGETKADNPFGLVTYLSPSNIQSHRKPKKDVDGAEHASTFKDIWNTAINSYRQHYDEHSYRNAIPIDLGIGVCIQTCGHYLHMDCFNSYVNGPKKSRSLLTQFRNNRFQCPMCRSVGNAFLPCIKDSLGTTNNNGQDETTDEENVNELKRLFKKRNTLVLSPKQKLGVDRFLQDLTKCYVSQSSRDPDKTPNSSTAAGCSSSAPSIVTAQAISSLLLNCLGMEMVRIRNQADANRSCMPWLYSVFRYSYKSLSAGHSRKLAQIWEVICGSKASSKRHKEVPVLLHDVDLLLAHLVLQLPYGTETRYLETIVKYTCKLKIVQILCGLISSVDVECLRQVHLTHRGRTQDLLSIAITSILSNFDKTKYNQAGKDLQESSSLSAFFGSAAPSLLFNANELQSFVQLRISSFLRKASLLKTFICDRDAFEDSFESSSSVKCSIFNEIFHSISSESLEKVVPSWIEELQQGNGLNHKLLLPHIFHWDDPRLVDMHFEYHHIFETLRKLPCPNCSAVPIEPALCLTCNKIVCLNSFCCMDKKSKISEVIQHSIECGMGSSVFLCVLTSAILVVAGQEACVWGSIFLDSFGEEDLDLQRGKPLFLSRDRFQFLQRQWSTNSFLKSELKWFPHDNML